MTDFHFRPNRLRDEQAEQLSAVESGRFSGDGDFGAYRGFNTGLNRDWIKPHGIHDDRTAERYVRDVARLVGLPRGGALCDLGSGLGCVTDAFRRVLASDRAVGIEMSDDGVAYARRTYAQSSFLVMAIDPTSDLGGPYDVIHAREFYPFSRTDDPAVHLGYLGACARALADGGYLLVTLHAGLHQPSLQTTLATLPSDALGLSPFTAYAASSARLRHWLPLPIARVASAWLRRLTGRRGAIVYVSRKTSREQ